MLDSRWVSNMGTRMQGGKRLASFAAQIALSPISTAALLTSAKTFANPVIGNARLNALGLHALRVKLAHRVAEARRKRLGRELSAADKAAFARDGFLIRENFLPEENFAALSLALRQYRGHIREVKEGDSLNRKIAVDGETKAAIPALNVLLSKPEWRQWIRYIGAYDAEPSVFIQSIHRRAGAVSRDPQTILHADTFHPTAKAWLFLTDVAEDQGPLCYVPGSHRLTRARLEWERRMSLTASIAADGETREGSFRIAPEELTTLALPQPRPIAVRANTLVVADTFGFHARGPCADQSVRLAIWALGRRSPFLPWTPQDLWTGFALRHRHAAGFGYRLSRLRHSSRREPFASIFDEV